MEKRFPDSARSYVKLKDMNVCGGDLSIIGFDFYTANKDFWGKLFDARKSYLRQAGLIGFDILILLLLRRLTFTEVVNKVTHMDIDKPHQLELARKELS
jgi:hypothetical protein